MKILLCHNFYRYRGGEDVFVEKLAALLESRGHAVHWLAAHNRDLAERNLVGKLGSGIAAFYARDTMRRAYALIDAHQPDIAHVHNVFPQLSPSLYVALARRSVPVVQHVHNFRFLCPNGLFYTHGELCQRCADGNFAHAVRLRCLHGSLTQSAVYAGSLALHWALDTFPEKLGTLIVANPFTALQLWQRLGEDFPIHVLEHFIDPLPRAGRTALGKTVVYMGRLSEEKGIGTILDAAALLPGVPFRLVGSGPLEDTLPGAARERGLDNVEVRGFVGGEARFEALEDALCAIVPSLVYEQFGMAALEAYAYELPVIATKMGALRHIVEEGRTGLLIPPGDAEALAAAIRQLADNPEQALAMGQRGRRLAETTYSPDRYYERLMQVYGDALS